MMRSRMLIVMGLASVLGIIASLSIHSARADGEGETSTKFAIGDLAWMTGDWRSERNGELLQEIWSEPIGDSMMCAFRWMKGGKSWMYELVTITEEDKGITLRLKHFSNKMVGWEAKDECLDVSLVRLTDREAVFEHPTRRNLKRLTYTRPTDDTLIARVEGVEEDGSVSSFDIKFTLHR